jgi:hypothetical protein
MNFKPKRFPSTRSKTGDRVTLIISFLIVSYSLYLGGMFMPPNVIFFLDIKFTVGLTTGI